MQVNTEIQAAQTHPPAGRKNVQGRMLCGEVQKNGQYSNPGKSRPKGRNRQKKKSNGKNTSRAPKQQNGNVDSTTVAVDQNAETGRELQRSPLKGVKTLFQGNQRSNEEMRLHQLNLSYTRPATPFPSRKHQDKDPNGVQVTLDRREIKHQQSSSAASSLSTVQIQDQKLTPGPNGFTKLGLQAGCMENLHPRQDTDAAKSVNQNQKKRRNRKKGKRGCSPSGNGNAQCQPAQLDPSVKYEECPPRSNVIGMSPQQMTNRPPPIPTIAFEVKPDRDFSSEDASSSIRIPGQEMVPKIDRNVRKDTVDKSSFPRGNGVVRILQNKTRGMDVGSTHTRNQQQQRPISHVSPPMSTPVPASRAYRVMESEYQDPRPMSSIGSGRVQSEVSRVHESEITAGNLHRSNCHGPSPGASSEPIRTRVSSQDVRHDGEGAPRVRRTARKPRRKPFHKKWGQ